MEVKSKTVIVVTFIPPPVLPGAAPTSISKGLQKDSAIGKILKKSTVLKPAVRGVTAVNNEAKTRLFYGQPWELNKKVK